MRPNKTPSGLCMKTYNLAKEMEPNELSAVMDRYCHRDAQFLCLKKFGFQLHERTLLWLVADNALLDFLE